MLTQLPSLNFGTIDIQIFGTKEEPLIKCTDIIVRLLEYRDTSKAKWFSKMAADPMYVQTPQNGGCPQMHFTELGIYKALMKSNKPIAEQFQKQVCSVLKTLRLAQCAQFEALTIKYSQARKTGIIYGMKHKNYQTTDYVGFTTNTIQDRLITHNNDITKHIKIPFYKCLLIQALENYQIIELQTVDYYDISELRDRELYWQLFHQSIQDGKKLKCQKCLKEYTTIKPFENHRAKCYN